MSRFISGTAFDPGTGCDSGERGYSELPCFNLEPKDQISRIASSTSQQKKKQINFLSHTFLHATMIDLRRHLFADARVKMTVELGTLSVSMPQGDVYTASRCRCHDGLCNMGQRVMATDEPSRMALKQPLGLLRRRRVAERHRRKTESGQQKCKESL